MKETERILRAADDAMKAGDMDGYWGAHADDAVAHFAGATHWAGTYKGLGEIKNLFDKFMSQLESFTFETHDYLGSDTHAVALQTSHYTRAGKTFDSNDLFIFHVENGKISEFWLIPENQAEFDAFFA